MTFNSQVNGIENDCLIMWGTRGISWVQVEQIGNQSQNISGYEFEDIHISYTQEKH